MFRVDLASVPAMFIRLTGDYNLDGRVDAADYSVWRDTLGSTNDLRANGDNTGASIGVVDEADYTAWKNNFGTASSATAASIPEPSALLLSCVFGGLTFGALGLRQSQLRCLPNDL